VSWGLIRILGVVVGFVTFASRAAAQASPTSEESAGQTVRVYVSSDRPGTVFGSAAALGTVRRLRWPRQPADEFHYERGVCVAPCVATVPLVGNPYRFVGHAVASSSRFDLAANPAGLDVRVHAAPYGANVVGVVFTALGLSFAAVGGGELIASAALSSSSSMSTEIVTKVFLYQGIAFGSLGIIIAAIGIPMWVANHTSVAITRHESRAASRVQLTPFGLRF